ncbi:MAG: SRPBCC domain-containing protein [Flavobacteriaceae bacterium]|nr:SRPBCC domain-containing protein [Flavobacteriaceae bacterium]
MTTPENPTNYSRSVSINAPASKAFAAITEGIDQWWSTLEGEANTIGGVFTVSFGKDSFWKFKVVRLGPSDIVWQCIESHQDHHLKGMDAEWLDSLVRWHISDTPKGIRIDFLHDGLLSDGVCYDVCSAGWDFYILDSLKSYLETGTGKPGQN